MTRTQLSFRLLKQARTTHSGQTDRALTDVVPALVSHLRSADAGGHWHFRRAGSTADSDVEVCFHATPTVIDELDHQLRSQSRVHGWPMRLPPPRHGAGTQGPAARGGAPSIADRLSGCSSDFALNVLANGGIPDDCHLAAAAVNLRFVTEIMPGSTAADRAAFLFLGWQQWSQELTPGRRVRLGGAAAEAAAALLAQTCEVVADPRWSKLWRDYFAAVESILAAQEQPYGPPVRYVLFEHAHLTHNRLGITAATEALAARALRAALATTTQEQTWR